MSAPRSTERFMNAKWTKQLGVLQPGANRNMFYWIALGVVVGLLVLATGLIFGLRPQQRPSPSPSGVAKKVAFEVASCGQFCTTPPCATRPHQVYADVQGKRIYGFRSGAAGLAALQSQTIPLNQLQSPAPLQPAVTGYLLITVGTIDSNTGLPTASLFPSVIQCTADAGFNDLVSHYLLSVFAPALKTARWVTLGCYGDVSAFWNTTALWQLFAREYLPAYTQLTPGFAAGLWIDLSTRAVQGAVQGTPSASTVRYSFVAYL